MTIINRRIREPYVFVERCAGLNNVYDPVQEPESVKQFLVDLSDCINVVVTDNNRIQRVDGYTSLASLTNGHSLFCDGGDCLVNQGTTLYQVKPNLTLSSVRTGLSGEPLSHAQYGPAIYYSNTRENGIFYDGASNTWDIDVYNGPDTTRYFEESVPKFSHIAVFNGYMLGFIDNALYASEHGSFGLWNMIPVWFSDSRGLMIKPVYNGVFISNESRQYFLEGAVPEDFKENLVAEYPAYEWSDAIDYVDSSDVIPETVGLCAVWWSHKGLCIGTAGGQFAELIKKKIIVLKAKNYVLYDRETKKLKIKGSALRDSKKEKRVKDFQQEIINAIIHDNANFKEIYSRYVKEATTLKDINGWLSKRTYTKKIDESDRTNETKVKDAIIGSNYKEGDKLFLYFLEDGTLKLAEHFDGNYDRLKMAEKVYKSSQVFDAVLPTDDLFINYKLKKNKAALDKLLES